MSYSDQPPPPPAYGAPPPGAAPAGNNSKALWSMITGIVGLLCCQILGPVAIFLGLQARKEIQQTGQGGGGMATAGLVLGVLATIWLVISLILIATGNFYYEFDTNS